MKKQKHLFLTVLILMISTSHNAQTVDQIIDNYFKTQVALKTGKMLKQ